MDQYRAVGLHLPVSKNLDPLSKGLDLAMDWEKNPTCVLQDFVSTHNGGEEGVVAQWKNRMDGTSAHVEMRRAINTFDAQSKNDGNTIRE